MTNGFGFLYYLGLTHGESFITILYNLKMKLPFEVENLCLQYLEKVRQDPYHKLWHTDRVKLYKAFQPASFDFPEYKNTGRDFDYKEYDRFINTNFQNMNKGDRAIGWLGLLTVYRVLGGWDLVENLDNWELQYLKIINEILQDCQEMLLGNLNFLETYNKLNNEYWYFTHFFVSYELACLKDAAIYALAVILCGAKEDEVAGRAETSYTIINHDLPGEADMPEVSDPSQYDFSRRLGFWEWWLTEAIPQAWELANWNFT